MDTLRPLAEQWLELDKVLTNPTLLVFCESYIQLTELPGLRMKIPRQKSKGC